MKILWMTIDFRKAKGPYRHYYLALEESLEKIADVTIYGRKQTEEGKIPSVNKLKPDVVVFYAGYNLIDWKEVEKIKVPKAMRCTDPWSNAPRHINIINRTNIDLVLLQYPSVKHLFEQRLKKAKVESLFQTVNADIFKPLNLERKCDIFTTGNCAYYYPMREAIFNAYHDDEKCWVRRGWTSIPLLKDYVVKINQSKILATGNCCLSVLKEKGFKMFQVKPIEAMATQTLLAMDTPTCHKELHLKPDFNFVPINLTNFRERLKYYLEHDKERRIIAKRGYETFMKHHTSDVRAKQLLKKLEYLVDGY